MARTLEEHLLPGTPKRILALDGGGIRGILTLGYLKHIEELLMRRSGAGNDFRLCDYFDLIGGTSTGSIIAAGLAKGFTVKELAELYRELGAQVFTRTGLPRFVPKKLRGLLAAKFPTEPVDKALQNQLGRGTVLGDASLRTGLMVMTKRIDTGSPWPLHNNPNGKYFNTQAGETGIPNRNFLLWQIVRASTAAPTYFEPELIEVASRADNRMVKGAFVDGGVSLHGNPALQLFMLATLEGYRLGWQPGQDQILLVSVGTGSESLRLDADKTMHMKSAELGVRSLASLMGDADAFVRLMMQWLGYMIFSIPEIIDGEVGDLRTDTIGASKLLSYVRYNALFEQQWLREHAGKNLSEAQIDSLVPMDRPENIQLLHQIGDAAGAKFVLDEHFPHSFDVN
jgi:uncharacterized protein